MPKCNRCSYDLEGVQLKGGAVTCPECGMQTPVFTDLPPPPLRPTFERQQFVRAHCRACGYLLEGLPSGTGDVTCPECGLIRDPREADGPGVMPRFPRALAIMITPAAALWLLSHVGRHFNSPPTAMLLALSAAVLWAFAAPVVIPMHRARKYGARPRIIFDEVATSYGFMLLAGFVLGLLLLVFFPFK
jgi:hypothetical protein